MNTAPFDVLILGAGCAGLSLASRLAAAGGRCPRTAILDPRTAFPNDRTWCFWRTPEAARASLISREWPVMEVASDRTTARVSCGPWPYAMIRAADFYQQSLAEMSGNHRVELHPGRAALGQPVRQGTLWVVETPNGPIRSSMIVDTRPRRPFPAAAILWQSFSGAEVRLGAPRFPTDKATLMDFRRGPKGRILFTYLLPFSSTRALVEVTEFSDSPRSSEDLEGDLEREVRHYAGGAAVEILRRESGALPMGGSVADSPNGDGSLVHAGFTAGAVRPATGYAFQRIQRWAATCSAELVNGRFPTGHTPDPWWMSAMDALFLTVLRNRPNLAPEIFSALFSSAPAPAMIRFLSDHPTFPDLVRVAAALPAWPFLEELAATCRGKALQWRESLAA